MTQPPNPPGQPPVPPGQPPHQPGQPSQPVPPGEPPHQPGQPPVPPGQPPAYQGPTAPPQGNNPLAIASLIVGILALVMVPCLPLWFIALPAGLLAVVLGFIARAQIRRGQGAGMGMATTGLVLGGIAVLIVLAMVVVFFIFGEAVVDLGERWAEELERQQQHQNDEFVD